ncbi:L-threonylcarbamoyladenylate synthase [Candidatus Pelagibacter ubique]|nr:L-threonylcarbamoyladenylate synthase [Candidatus Pelagibacter bacterium]MDA8845422.1 L-threonylcarbamoyladenylate synthase [Candidatus Pelagibacter bacterium]MDA9193575.1 L-threonylcarbamoyladenylate synthase [Candidatus Pelagibacter ubique]
MKSNQSNIKKAKKYLDKNYCIGVPTETVYGLAANAYKNSAVKKVYNLKKRPKNNPLIVHYHDIDSLKKDCLINDNFIKLYKKFSPGPITYVLQLKKNSKISKYVTNNKKSLAVRFPKHTIFKNLLKQLDYPLAAPSANITTKVSAVKAKDVKEEFGNKIKYILDGGTCAIGIESTIVNLTDRPAILRLGGLDISKIQKALGFKMSISTNPKKKIAPGQSRLHYSPGIPLRMNVKKPKNDEAFIIIKKKKTKLKNYFYLTSKSNLDEAAKNLYSCLRKIKNKGYKSIAVEKIPNIGLGKTINDRLRRASKY